MSEANLNKAKFKCKSCHTEVVAETYSSDLSEIIYAECPECGGENWIKPEDILEEDEELDCWEEEGEEEKEEQIISGLDTVNYFRNKKKGDE